jgi:lipopolysaccharide transport system ATP-binding protein
MNKIAIRVENLSKQYSIGMAKYRHDTLRDHLKETITAFFRRDGHSQNAKEIIWALKDVSLEVKQGEVIGIIGRNGAGKSTLLKILSRITEPTTGHVDVYGRISSLLEVGTGFHAELTGRDNIFLNGAILGMRNNEIKQKFDEIVAFAEIDKFIDTPVKRYSSGMYVRLAFAVAAHLEPEILIVDEVLAVGDAAFQKKCLGKMESVAKTGRTVLFVSHNLGSITQLCSSAILLDEGRVLHRGKADETVARYLAKVFPSHKDGNLENSSERKGDGRLKFVDVYLRNTAGDATNVPIAGCPVDIVLEFASSEELYQVDFTLTIYNQMMIPVTHCGVDACGQRFHISRGRGQVICCIPKLPLPRGSYKIAVAAADDIGDLDWVPTACLFNVEVSNFFPTAYMPPIQYSTALVEHSWH